MSEKTGTQTRSVCDLGLENGSDGVKFVERPLHFGQRIGGQPALLFKHPALGEHSLGIVEVAQRRKRRLNPLYLGQESLTKPHHTVARHSLLCVLLRKRARKSSDAQQRSLGKQIPAPRPRHAPRLGP